MVANVVLALCSAREGGARVPSLPCQELENADACAHLPTDAVVRNRLHSLALKCLQCRAGALQCARVPSLLCQELENADVHLPVLQLSYPISDANTVPPVVVECMQRRFFHEFNSQSMHPFGIRRSKSVFSVSKRPWLRLLCWRSAVCSES